MAVRDQAIISHARQSEFLRMSFVECPNNTWETEDGEACEY